MLYFERVSSFMHHISTNSAPTNVCVLFTHSSDVHLYSTGFSDAGWAPGGGGGGAGRHLTHVWAQGSCQGFEILTLFRTKIL